jgi:hypothetical protein
MMKFEHFILLISQNYNYSYDDMDKINPLDDDFDESQIDEMMMEYGTSSDSDEEKFVKESKNKKKKFAYDVTEGDIESTSKANADEISTLLEEDDEDEEEDRKKGKKRWTSSKRAKRISIPKRKKKKETK